MASVAKRKWTYQGQAREAWVCRYKDRGGTHRSRQFDRKKEADDFKRHVENELEAGTHVARTQSVTIAALVDEYAAEQRAKAVLEKVGPQHVANVHLYLGIASEYIGAIRTADLRWQDVTDMAGKLADRPNPRHGRPIARSTVRQILQSLSTALDYAARRGYCARNAVRDAQKELGGEPRLKRATFTTEQVRALFEGIEAPLAGYHDFARRRLRAMVYLAAACGLRRGEICGLKAADFDFVNGRVTVARNLRIDDVLKAPKTAAGVREVPMPEAVGDAVQAYLAVAVPDKRGLVFRSRTGTQINEHVQYHAWQSLLRRAGLPRADERGRFYQFHALRHFAGSAWLGAGVPLTDVSKMLGHANVGVTARIYSHSISNTAERAPVLEHCMGLLLPPITQEMRKIA